MLHDAEHAPGDQPSAGRSAQENRPSSASVEGSKILLSEIFDDAIRIGERLDRRYSNAWVGRDLGVNEAQVRRWRDPHDESANLPAHKLLLMSEHLYGALVERLTAKRAELRGVPAPAAPMLLALAIASAGAFIAAAGRAVHRSSLTSSEREEIERLAFAALGDLRRLVQQLGARST